MCFKADFDVCLSWQHWRNGDGEFEDQNSRPVSASYRVWVQARSIWSQKQYKTKWCFSMCFVDAPLYLYLQTIWSSFICYICWVVIQFSVPHYKSQLSRASLKIHIFSNISHFDEIHLTFAVPSDVPVHCFFYCEHIFQSVKVPFVYFCFGVFVFKSDPKIFQVCQCHGDFPLSMFELFYKFFFFFFGLHLNI